MNLSFRNEKKQQMQEYKMQILPPTQGKTRWNLTHDPDLYSMTSVVADPATDGAVWSHD